MPETSPKTLRTHTRLWTLLACLASASPAWAVPMGPAAVAGPDAAVGQTVVKGLVNAIRYGKDDVGARRLGVVSMAKALMGPTWTELSADEQAHLTDGLRKLLVGTSFPRGREMFQYLDAILFKQPVRQGSEMRLQCTIVVHRELKKAEIPVEWVLGQEEGAWKVVDIVSQQESTVAGIRDQEILPLLKEGGKAKLLATLDERVAKLPAAKATDKKP